MQRLQRSATGKKIHCCRARLHSMIISVDSPRMHMLGIFLKCSSLCRP